LPTKGSEPKVITYEEMYYKIPEVLRNIGLGLYQYNSYLNALGKSHNDMSRTMKKGYDETQAIFDIITKNDFSSIEPERVELFKAQLKSYDLSIYPKLNEVKRIINEDLQTMGNYPNTKDFRDFCMKNSIEGISERYFSDFYSVFDPKMFTKI
jgi:hypothetical protein